MSPVPAPHKARSLVGGLALAIAAVALSGCITLLPKDKPSQLYRFGDTVPASAPASAPAASAAKTFVVRLEPIGFDRPAAGDRILTMTGDEAAYIGGARWVGSATGLFEAAVINAFDAQPGPARLQEHGELGKSNGLLTLNVRTFETRYEGGPAAAPTIVVRLHAGLTVGDGPPRERMFETQVPAGENRGGAIAAAYDRAVATVLGDLTAWVDAAATAG